MGNMVGRIGLVVLGLAMAGGAAAQEKTVAVSGVIRDENGRALEDHLILLASFLALTFATIIAAPLYWRWYAFMRRRDDRGSAGIVH